MERGRRVGYGGGAGPFAPAGSATVADRLAMKQVRELVLRAREDAALWQALRENERRLERSAALGVASSDPAAVLNAPKVPTVAMMVADLVDRHCEPDDDFNYDALMIMLRCAVRADLGLPVDLKWDPDDRKGMH